MLWLGVLNTIKLKLSRDLPTYLITMLGGFLQWAIRLKNWHVYGQGKNHRTTAMYDLVNCGPNHRFQTSNGVIAHNCLALGYGMGPKKMKKQCYDSGFDISAADCKTFYNVYWDTFPRIRKLTNALAAKAKKETYIINPFGYRLKPEPHKAFNFFIQSSVSGLINILCEKFFTAAPYAEFITIIHDVILMAIPDDRLGEAKKTMQECVKSLNDDLKWSVPIRMGWAEGSTWHEAK